MNFEEWYNRTYSKGCSDSHKLNAKTAWNTAVDEVNHIVCKHYNDDDLLMRIRELKE